MMVQLLSFHNQSRVPFIFQCILNIEIPMIPRISHFFPMISPFFQSPTVAGSPRALVSQDPGRNLADKLLNEPGQPPRCCVVLRIAGEEGGKMGGVLDQINEKCREFKNIDLCPKSKITKRKWGFQHFSFKTWGFEWQRW